MESPTLSNLVEKLNICVDEGSAKDDAALAQHFRQIWVDNGVPETKILPDWEARCKAWYEGARNRDLGFKTWVVRMNDDVIASAGCQLHDGLYPYILDASVRKYGYISFVYVENEHRGKGIGRGLIKEASAYLKTLGCSHAVLNASPTSKDFYKGLGFTESNEMKLEL